LPSNKSPDRIAWIDTVDPSEATGALERQYRSASRRAGSVAHVIQLQSLTPKALDAGIRLYQALMIDEGPLPRSDREMIATAVSQTNHCFY